MNDEKYVVIKRDEYVDWFARNVGVDDQLTPLDDAVVIRTQDVFATSGLRAYRDTMLTHMNLLSVLPPSEVNNRYITPIIQNLRRAVAYFTEVTIEAEDRFNRGDVKIPD